SRIRHTGGFAFGATSTRSSPASRALSSASWIGTTPVFWPWSSMIRTSRTRMRSLMRRSRAITGLSKRAASGELPSRLNSCGVDYNHSDGGLQCTLLAHWSIGEAGQNLSRKKFQRFEDLRVRHEAVVRPREEPAHRRICEDALHLPAHRIDAPHQQHPVFEHLLRRHPFRSPRLREHTAEPERREPGSAAER